MTRFTAELKTADCIGKTLVGVLLKSTYLLVGRLARSLLRGCFSGRRSGESQQCLAGSFYS